MLTERMARVRMIVLDVDGTLTDGGIYVLDSGEGNEALSREGMGWRSARLRRQGYRFGFISGSKSERTVRKRATDLGVEYVYVGAGDKQAVVAQWLEELDLVPEQVLYMGRRPKRPGGDALLRRAGLSGRCRRNPCANSPTW